MTSFKTLVLLFPLFFSISSLANNDQCSHFYKDPPPNKMSQLSPMWGNRIHNWRYRPKKVPKDMLLVNEGTEGQVPKTTFWQMLYPYSPNKGNYTFGNLEIRTLDQSTSKECFLYSYLTSLENAYANRSTAPRPLRFRAEYLIAKKFEHVIANLISRYAQPFHFNLEGGELPHAIELVQQHGLVPEDIWRPLILADGSDGKNGWDFNSIYETIKTETDIVRNNLILNPNYYAPKNLNDIKKDIFDKALSSYVGIMPKPFIYDGVEHTPESFGKMYGQSSTTPIEVRYMHGELPYPDKQKVNLLSNVLLKLVPQSPHPVFRPQPLNEVLKHIKDGLTNGKMVNIDINGTVENFGHSLAVTDMEITPSGVTVAIKVKNTYRKPWGYNGYVWISPQEFDRLVRRVWIVDIN
tara:strand:+ start:13337 stop:14560 length:1224 start_codon:yes stop_codon:yes gene_type:complete